MTDPKEAMALLQRAYASRDSEIVAHYAAGGTIDSIACEYRISRSRAAQTLHEQGVRLRPRGRSKGRVLRMKLVAVLAEPLQAAA